MADQRYMKKPVVVDAYQLPAAGQDLPESFQQWCERVGFTEFESGRDETLVIPTLEGDMTAQPGDWIIRGVRGEFYPCKPDIFAATYEAEPEASPPAADEVPDAVIDAVAAARSMAAPEQAARKVLDAALQWWCEREINDWDEADLARALIDYEGDWPGCPGCDHDCDEPCMPATVAQQHAAIDHRIADLVHEGKLHPPAGYTPPDGWQPGPAPRSRQQRVRAAMQQADRDGPMPGMIAAFEARYSGDWTDPVWRDETATWAGTWAACLATQQAAQPADVARAILAADHAGMRVDYTGLMKAAQQCATKSDEKAHAFMLGELQKHLTELGQRYYAGDAAVVDEFLQLYCIGREERAALKKGSPS